MLLNIIFLCLIASITSVSGDCDDGISEEECFDWYKVGISVLTRFLKQATFKTAADKVGISVLTRFLKQAAFKTAADKVGISVLTRFLKQAAFKTAACVYILFVVPLTNSQ
jgi:predicted DNA-binding protein (UPF0251 family)